MEKIRSAGTGDAVRGGAADARGATESVIDNREKLTMTDIADIDSFDEAGVKHAKLRKRVHDNKGRERSFMYSCWI